MPEPVLSIKDLVVEFKTEDGIVHAVDGVSYDLFPGETLGIVGESGSGKSVSTLALLGLIPQPPGRIVSGTAMFKGRDLLKLKKTRAAPGPGQRGRDGLPGPDDVAQPRADGRQPARRGDQDALPGREGRRREEARHRPVEARGRPQCGDALHPVPARVLGRHAPAGDDRDGDHELALPPDRRRADHRARRDDPGSGARGAEARAGGDRGGDDPDHARPGHRGRDVRSRPRHVRGTHRRVRHRPDDLPSAAASVHDRADEQPAEADRGRGVAASRSPGRRRL